MHSRSNDSPAAIPFLAGHVLWTVLNTSSLTTMLLPFVCLFFSGVIGVPVRCRARTENDVVYQASLWPGKSRASLQGLRMLKQDFQRLPQILGDAEHHFAAGLHLALLQFRHIRTIHADTPRQVRL